MGVNKPTKLKKKDVERAIVELQALMDAVSDPAAVWRIEVERLLVELCNRAGIETRFPR